MELNRLLKRQVQKYLSPEDLQNERMQQFIQKVNNSYNGYERDQLLAAHAFSISEQDYAAINSRLQEEIEIRIAGVKNLKKAIQHIGEPDDEHPGIDADEENLIDTLHYLELQIEKRKRTERELKNSESRLSATATRLYQLIANLQTGVLLEDDKGRVLLANQLFSHLFNLPETPDALAGRAAMDVFGTIMEEHNDPPGIKAMLKELMVERKMKKNLKLSLKDGRALQFDYVPILVDDQYNGQLWNFRDVTKEREDQREMMRLSMVASANTGGVIFTDQYGRIFWCNNGFLAMTGFVWDEVIGKTPIELCKGDLSDRSTLRKVVESLSAGENFQVDVVYYRKDGSCFWGRTKGQAIRNPDNHSLQYFGIIEDITFDKEQEEIIERLSLVASANAAGVVTFDANEKVAWLNPAFERITGYSLDDLKGESPIPYVYGPLTDPEVVKRIVAHASKRENCSEEFIHYRKDGSTFWAKVHMQFVMDEGNNLIQHFVTVEDITARKQAEQALQYNEEKYRNIIANMNLGLLEVDNRDMIQFANQGFCDMSGYELAELVGRHAGRLFTGKQDVALLESENQLRRQGVSDAYELAVKNKRGELRWWLISGAPRYNDTGARVGSIGIHLDITQQKQMEIELNEAREAALQSSRAKEAFLANMSHEIRTPMNAVLGLTRQLLKTDLTEQQRFFLDVINSSAGHLLVIINDILDISKIEAGKLQLEFIGFRPAQLVYDCLQVMRHRAEEKGLQLVDETNFDPQVILVSDPHRITQVMLNLLSNAVKFTEKGRVTISGGIRMDAQGREELRFSISDTGIGITREYQQHIFENFSQEDRNTARKYGGSGLGMAITHQLVKLMNGHISVQSQRGAGTTFHIQLPVHRGREEDIPAEPAVGMDSSVLKDKRILLVEDNEMNRLVATTVLQNVGAQVMEVENGQQAVDELRRDQSYDAILMDVQMPVLDGLEATLILRNELGVSMPIIALTANAIKGESDRCREAGMNDFVSKPFEEAELINKLVTWINPPNAAVNNKQEPEPDNAEVPTVRLYDLSKLKQFSRGDVVFEQRMIRLFIDQNPRMMEEMATAFAQGNMAAVKAIAHKIKPSMDSMGIPALFQLMRDIEQLAAGGTPEPQLSGIISKAQQLLRKVVAQLQAER